ncbi:HPr family phosphocarrier protein [Dendrosporobacter sp. 1207_IL3150]|uniref:HPr family phosphocarrier protein n=1 Tax=Dendrosporobacter sp. 1207_IL3150 TaxID=3084054 RepID=UPI002FD93240
MVERELMLTNNAGLHARPAAQFVQKAAGFKSKIRITAGAKTIDGKSILSILSLGLNKGKTFILQADGQDEVECIAALEDLVQSKFGEE